MESPSLLAFLKKYNVSKSDKKAPFNILSLNGGKYFIPPAVLDELYSILAGIVVENRHFFYLLEVKGPVFPYFIDVDFKQHEQNDDDYIDFMSKLCLVVRACYPSIKEVSPQFEYYVLKSEYNSNIHVVYPNIIVGRKEAMYITMEFLRVLKENTKEEKLISWEEILDVKPYGRNCSLRMYAASKCTRHAGCNKADCSVCGGTKFIHLGRRYYVKMQSDNGTVQKDNLKKQESLQISDHIHIFKKCSVICNEEAIPNNEFRPINNKKRKGKSTTKISEIELAPRVRKNVKEDDEDATSVWNILKKLPSLVNEVYKKCVIRSIEFKDDKYSILTTSKYCLNLPRSQKNKEVSEHKNNHVYFEVTRDSITQKCFCTCSNKTCKSFSSPPVHFHTFLSALENSIIFPNKCVLNIPLTLKKLRKEDKEIQKEIVEKSLALRKWKKSII